MKTKKSTLIVTTLLFVAMVTVFFVYKKTYEPETKVTTATETREWTCAMHPKVRQKEPGNCPICGMTLIPTADDEETKTTEKKIKYWQAPMDPSYTQNKPGKSPMGMDLVPVYEEGDNDTPNTLKLSPKSAQMAEVDVRPVTRAFATETLRVSGKLTVDETRLETISAWFPGRIEQLFIDYTGITVAANAHMARLYSPELQVAQKELLAAVQSNAPAFIAASKEKLRLWGFSQSQIQAILASGQVSDTLTLQTTQGGTVLKKYVQNGDYVQTGSKIYDIANLDRLWFVADIYESDIAKISYGQKAQVHTPAYPGEKFEVVMTFIDPVVNPQTRTIKVRGVLSNHDHRLKPGMLAKATIAVVHGSAGPIQNPTIKTLYVCPMHPEEFANTPGHCPICQMPLEKTAKLGLVSKSVLEKPLRIPDTAVLITGTRAIVYIQIEKGRYEGRVVTLGPKVGEFYIVRAGLSEGDLVVTKGNFKIDSAMQLQAKPSMMTLSRNTPSAQFSCRLCSAATPHDPRNCTSEAFGDIETQEASSPQKAKSETQR